jgi:hypothetical protein
MQHPAVTPGDAHPHDRIRELADRRPLLVPAEEVVRDVNRFLRAGGYFLDGNSARHFVLMRTYATDRLALSVAKRHRRARPTAGERSSIASLIPSAS